MKDKYKTLHKIANMRPGARFVILAAAGMILYGMLVKPASADLTNRYVVKNNPGAAEPYDALTNAAGDIQTAINYAYAGETVLVAPGTYDNGGAAVPGYEALTNRAMINKAIFVRSLDGNPTTTIIEGAWDPATNGPAAVRGAYVGSGAALVGFTLRNGATLITTPNQNLYGGGVYCQGTGSVISNCVIANNAASGFAGGVYSGTIYDSLIVSNRSLGSYGGGAYNSILKGCTVSHNRAYNYGGGGSSLTASNCVFSFNRANGGGAASGGTFYNCLMYGNLADSQGGGAVWHSVSLYNCTIVGNQLNGSAAGIGGGGIYVGSTRTVVAINCIVYSNQATSGPNIYVNPPGILYITNSCTIPEIPGWNAGNTTNAPCFITYGTDYGTNHVAGNYRLQKDSPCANSGLNQPWMPGAKDLDGNQRIDRFSGTVDMGCYEYLPRGMMFMVR